MMQLGCDGLFVGSDIFKSKNPKSTAKAIVEATTHYKNPEIIAKVSEGMGDAMKGLEISQLDVRMQERGK
jgi:pyridoxal 5'-phosphate synthase pdxS subunit